MKTIEEIINSTPVYLHDWEKGGKMQLIEDFEGLRITKEQYEALTCKEEELYNEDSKGWEVVKILFASYAYVDYSGAAWVLFAENGKLFEVSGEHCSCFGLEGQWEPEGVVLAELENRIINGTFGNDGWDNNTFRDELIKFLSLDNKNEVIK